MYQSLTTFLDSTINHFYFITDYSSTKHYENIILKVSWKYQCLSIEEKKCDKIDVNNKKIFLKIKNKD